MSKQRMTKTVEGAIVKNVSSPATIQRIAKEKGLNPQEVFVRVTFEHEGKTYTVSNKLRYLRKEGYTELLNARQNETPLKLSVDVESGFFYIDNDVKIDDLFAEEIVEEDTRSKLTDLL